MDEEQKKLRIARRGFQGAALGCLGAMPDRDSLAANVIRHPICSLIRKALSPSSLPIELRATIKYHPKLPLTANDDSLALPHQLRPAPLVDLVPSTLKSSCSVVYQDSTPRRIRQRWVYGRGQMVHWEQCNISVVERDSGGNKMTMKTYEKSDGKGIVPNGTELYFS